MEFTYWFEAGDEPLAFTVDEEPKGDYVTVLIPPRKTNTQEVV